MLTFMSEESSVNLEATFKFFKTMCTKSTNIFVVDKDFNEIFVLKRVFPEAKILLCTFHVLKYEKNLIATVLVQVEKKNDIMSSFKEMLYARSLDSYDEKKRLFFISE